MNEARSSGTVALLWALEETGETFSAEASDQLDRLNEFETVVVVCPPRHFSALRSRDCFFEALPAPDDIQRAGLSRDWDLYIRRRIARIRSNWSPDFEFVVGSPPESCFESLAALRKGQNF
ncbi:MAG: hypothetical protein Tsb0019_27170 [Roseibium sp.]